MIETVLFHFRGAESDSMYNYANDRHPPGTSQYHDKWIPLAVSQFRKYNPNIKAYFLTTNTNYNSLDVDLVDLNKMQKDVKSFKKNVCDFYDNYIHFSSNPGALEKPSLCRWIDMSECIKEYKITGSVLYIESDNLVYENVSNWDQMIKDYWFSLVNGTCGGSMIINDIDGFHKLSEFIVSTYRDKTPWFEAIKKTFENMQANKHKGGISDMSFLGRFSHKNTPKIHNNLDEVVVDSSVVDTHLRNVKEWRGRKWKNTQIKDIVFKDNQPYCFSEKYGKEMRLKTLHFVGNTKELIPDYIRI